MNFSSITGMPSWPQALSIDLLIFCRLIGVFFFSPLFSRIPVSGILCFAIALFLSLSLTIPLSTHFSNTFSPHLIFQELAIGYLIGFFFALFIETLYLSSEVLKEMTGFYTSLTTFAFLGACFVFLAADVHHLALRLLVESFSFLSPSLFDQAYTLPSFAGRLLFFPLAVFTIQCVLLWVASRLFPEAGWASTLSFLKIFLSFWIIFSFFDSLLFAYNF